MENGTEGAIKKCLSEAGGLAWSVGLSVSEASTTRAGDRRIIRTVSPYSMLSRAFFSAISAWIAFAAAMSASALTRSPFFSFAKPRP
jgi:hypothetical protein